MDEMMTPKPRTRKAPAAMDMTPVTPTVSEPTTFHEHLHHHRSTRILLIILGIVLVIIVVLGVWWQFFRKPAPLTPEQTLQSLKASSQPVTTTPQQQAADLSKLQKNSVQYQVTSQQRLDTLNALSK